MKIILPVVCLFCSHTSLGQGLILQDLNIVDIIEDISNTKTIEFTIKNGIIFSGKSD